MENTFTGTRVQQIGLLSFRWLISVLTVIIFNCSCRRGNFPNCLCDKRICCKADVLAFMWQIDVPCQIKIACVADSSHRCGKFLPLKPRLHERFFARAGDAIFSNFVASPARDENHTCSHPWTGDATGEKIARKKVGRVEIFATKSQR